MSSPNVNWQKLCEEITAQTIASCRKLHTALGGANEPPPLDLGEALEDAANEYLNVFEEISALHRKSPGGGAVTVTRA
jgi:hypothetical protein